MFACKCLNILFYTENNDIQKVELDSLQLSGTERIDAFFKKDIGRIVLENISKEQSGLVAARNVGSWIVHRCLNCSLDTHAVHKDSSSKGAASSVLIATDLLSGTSNISALRNNENYSSVFRVLIDYSQIMDLSKITEAELPSNVQLAIRNVDQQASEVLRREIDATEERIKHYSEMQYTALEAFKEQADLEHNVLVRLLVKHHYQPSEEFSTKMNTSVHVNQPISEENGLKSPRQSILKPKHPIVTNLTKPKRNVNRQMSQPVNRLESLDAEGLFPLEGMDESPISTHSDVEESDTDDSASHDEGIHIPRQRAHSMSVAKSLPMNIPVFMSAYTHDVAEEKMIPKAKEDSVDIAASIKALAKSVHGDAVFGDLPRPRFSTQI